MTARRLSALLLLAVLLPACGDGSTDPPPAAPSGLTIAGQTSGRVELSWTDESPDETGFTIEHSFDGGATWLTAGTVGVDVESFVDRGHHPLASVRYRVRATNNFTGWSGVATADLPAPSWGATAAVLPDPRAGHTLVYDSLNERLVMFGGFDGSSLLAEVWTLDVSGASLGTWTSHSPTGTPPDPRVGHSAVYDPVGERMIVFGGNVDPNPDPVVGDVWALSLPLAPAVPAWSLLTTTGTAPPARYDHAAVLDESRGRMLVYGGSDFSDALTDLRSLDLTTLAWADHGSAPVARHGHSAIYDAHNDRMVVHGGNDGLGTISPTTWFASVPVAGAATWTSFAPTPFARIWASAVYDEQNRRMIVFGGSAALDVDYGDVWTLTLGPGGFWQQASTLGSGPAPRNSASAAYDPVRERVVVFSGFSNQLMDFPDALAYPLELGTLP